MLTKAEHGELGVVRRKVCVIETLAGKLRIYLPAFVHIVVYAVLEGTSAAGAVVRVLLWT